MELNRNAAIGVVIAAVLTVVATAIVTWVITTSSAGVDAAEKNRIEGIVKSMLTLPDQRTHAQVLILLDKSDALQEQKLGIIKSSLDELSQDLDDIE